MQRPQYQASIWLCQKGRHLFEIVNLRCLHSAAQLTTAVMCRKLVKKRPFFPIICSNGQLGEHLSLIKFTVAPLVQALAVIDSPADLYIDTIINTIALDK